MNAVFFLFQPNLNFIDSASKYSRHEISWKSVQRETRFPLRRERERRTDPRWTWWPVLTTLRMHLNIYAEFRLINHWGMFGWPQQHNAMDITHQRTDYRTQFCILPCCIKHYICLGISVWCRRRRLLEWARARTPVGCVLRPAKLPWIGRSGFVWVPHAPRTSLY